MLINPYRKTLDVITQWFEITGTLINQNPRPVRIRIKELENIQPYGVQRKTRDLRYKR